MAIDSLGVGGVIAGIAGLILLLTLSSKVTKFLGSRKGIGITAAVLVVALFFANWFGKPQPQAGGESLPSLTAPATQPAEAAELATEEEPEPAAEMRRQLMARPMPAIPDMGMPMMSAESMMPAGPGLMGGMGGPIHVPPIVLPKPQMGVTHNAAPPSHQTTRAIVSAMPSAGPMAGHGGPGQASSGLHPSALGQHATLTPADAPAWKGEHAILPMAPPDNSATGSIADRMAAAHPDAFKAAENNAASNRKLPGSRVGSSANTGMPAGMMPMGGAQVGGNGSPMTATGPAAGKGKKSASANSRSVGNGMMGGTMPMGGLMPGGPFDGGNAMGGQHLTPAQQAHQARRQAAMQNNAAALGQMDAMMGQMMQHHMGMPPMGGVHPGVMGHHPAAGGHPACHPGGTMHSGGQHPAAGHHIR